MNASIDPATVPPATAPGAADSSIQPPQAPPPETHAPSPTLPTAPPITPTTLQQGVGLLKADVYLDLHAGRPVIRKDYGRYADSWMAIPARLLLRHEAHILEHLRHWPHAPNVIGQAGKLALLLEYVPGSNIIMSRGRVVLIDFASALYLPGGRLLRFLLRPLQRSDIAGGLKFKTRLTGEALTPREARLRRKPAWMTSLQRTWKRRLLPRLKRRFTPTDRRSG
ncbi:hypothetical protein F0A16_03785 [Salinicola corii]|uniref:Serine/threonine protein kinase n=1 Tax=Salinicola corii TaxID=2606937 RepID=A0A640WJR4_9GAMM|nr:hypothetical protein [Salinicola corii]KAA0020906.1 hypothetical protein F0A16_03785 [Salinicola corii]